MKIDPTNPTHVAFALMVTLMTVAILMVSLVEDIDTDVISMGMVGLMISALLVVKAR